MRFKREFHHKLNEEVLTLATNAEPESNSLAKARELEPAAASDPAAAELPPEQPMRVWLGAGILVLIGAGAYSAALGVPFHFEDRLYISENPSVQGFASIQRAFDNTDAGPVVLMSYALNWAIAPNSSSVFHAVNLILHLVNALFVYFLARLLVARTAVEPVPLVPLAAGLLFVLHPLATESVAYVVGRSSLLVTLFSLGTILAFLNVQRTEGAVRQACIGLTIACFVLALGSHRVAWLLPILLLATDWVLSGGEVKRRVYVHALLFVATAMTAGAGLSANGVANAELPAPLRMEAPLPRHVALARGVDLTINRRPLSTVQSAAVDSTVIEYAGNEVENFEETNVIPGLGVFALALFGGAVALASRKTIGLGLIWFAAASAFAVFAAYRGIPFSERQLYLPLAGVAIALAGLLAFVGGRKSVRGAIGLGVVALLCLAALASFTRTRVWLDEETLWDLAREHAAKSPVPYHRLAVMHAQSGEAAMEQAALFRAQGESVGEAAAHQQAQLAYGAAAAFLQASIERGADDVPARTLLGQALHMAGRPDEAETVLKELVREDPSNRAAIINLARLYESRANTGGDRENLVRAVDHFRRADSLAPLSPNLLVPFGRVLFALGDMSGSQSTLIRAAQLDNTSPAASILGEVQSAAQRIVSLEQQARAALATNPEDAVARLSMATVHVELGDFLPALYKLTSLLEDDPGNSGAWVTLGFVKARMGQAEDFLAKYPTAPVPLEGHASPWIEVARGCGRFGMWDAAAAYLEAGKDQTAEIDLPLLKAAELAKELGRQDVYGVFVQRAAETYADDPRPWLLLADIALESKNAGNAAQTLSEAARRGATPDQLAQRNQQLEELRKDSIGAIETVQ